MAAPKKDDARPQGLSWGEDDQETKVSPVRARAADDVKGLFASTQLGTGAATPSADQGGFFPKTPVGAKSPLDPTQPGSVAVPRPPPPSGDLSTISSLFGGQAVPAPPINGDEYSEAELSWQQARQKRDLLNDRLSSTELEPAPVAAAAAVDKKATMLGSFGLNAPPPTAAAHPAQAAAFAATVVAPPKPAPVAVPAARPAPAPAAALPPAPAPVRAPAERRSQPQPKRGKGAAPPPPPGVSKPSTVRAATMVLAGGTLLLILALAGGYAGLYPLTPEMEAILVDTGLREPPRAAAAPRATEPRSAPATPKSIAAKPAASAAVGATTVPVTAAAPSAPAKSAAKAPLAVPQPAAAKPVVAAAPKPMAAASAPAAAVSGHDERASADTARRKLASGDVAGAEAMARSLLAADPKDHHAMEVFARVLLAQGKAQEALGYIQQIVKKRAKRAAYRVLEGDAKLRIGDVAGARAAWNVAEELDPGNDEAARRLAGR